MTTQSVRLPDEIAARLDALARATRRSKSSFILEALEAWLDEREELEIALARFRDPATEWVDHEDARRELDLDQVGPARGQGGPGVAEEGPPAGV